jgi:hypothetical protein
MSIPFGPQLIGETEKTLDALLREFLDGTGITQPQWVTMRLAVALDGTVDADDLAAAVADRAHFPDAVSLVRGLSDQGLLYNGRVTASGRDLISDVQAKITAETAPIWDGLPADDVAAASRVLHEVIARARAVLGAPREAEAVEPHAKVRRSAGEASR